MRFQRILSIVLVLLMLTSVTVPTVTAGEVAPFVPAAFAVPQLTEMVICGVSVLISGVVALEIAHHVGKTWDGTKDGWNQLMKDTGKELKKLFHSKNWVKVKSDTGQAIMKSLYECYYSVGGDGGKRDDKWYIEARRNHGEIEINAEKRMNEKEAISEMGRGKDIMTLTKEQAYNLVARFKGLSDTEAFNTIRFEGEHDPVNGKFTHTHYEAKGMRLHCWSWSQMWK